MLRHLVLAFILSSANAFADTPDTVVAGAIVNEWVQGGLRVTSDSFDLGIQGKGFFVLRGIDGVLSFTRYGELGLDDKGYLVYKRTGDKVLGYLNDQLLPIRLSKYAKDADGSLLKGFRTDLDGTINSVYENGFIRQNYRVALALFQNPNCLTRKRGHLLHESIESGRPDIGAPQSKGRGSIYTSTLEELDEGMYRKNLQSSKTTKLEDEIRRAHEATVAWNKEKTLFYVYEMQLTKEELIDVEAALKKWGRALQGGVHGAEASSELIPEEIFASEVNAIGAELEEEILNIIGSKRLERIKLFRKEFNDKVFARFGIEHRFSGF